MQGSPVPPTFSTREQWPVDVFQSVAWPVQPSQHNLSLQVKSAEAGLARSRMPDNCALNNRALWVTVRDWSNLVRMLALKVPW